MSLTDYRIALVLIANECAQPTDKYTIARIQSIAHDALAAGVHLTGDERPEISDNQAALESLPDAVQGADLNLPARVIVDQHGHYWRDYGEFLSMCPVSEENTATEVVHVYALTETER